jgi:sporulation protein YlmC with PRC-barrel domain
MRASEFIGATVVDRDGRRLGQVSDLLLDDPVPTSICYALVDIAHSPDDGQRTVAVPWSLLRPESAGQPLVLAVSRDALQRLRAVQPS